MNFQQNEGCESTLNTYFLWLCEGKFKACVQKEESVFAVKLSLNLVSGF